MMGDRAVVGACVRAAQAGCALGAVALFALIAAGPALSASIQPLPEVYAGVASVSALEEHLDAMPAPFPTSEPVFASFADGISTYAPGQLYARSTPYYPGDTVTGLPGLVCELGGPGPPACSLPSYPLVAIADQQHADASISFVPQSVGPLSTGVLSGVAHVDQNGGETTSESVGDLSEGATAASAARIETLRSAIAGVLGRPVAATSSGTVSIATLSSTTSQHFADGVLTVRAEADDSGIDLLGGLVHIGSAQAVSVSTSDGAKIKTHSDTASLAGVSVAGIPATIDGNGISLLGVNLVPAKELASVATMLDQTLSSLGITVQYLGHTSGQASLTSSCPDGEADGLQLHFTHELDEVPQFQGLYYDYLDVGSACTSAFVGPPTVTTSSGPTSGEGSAFNGVGAFNGSVGSNGGSVSTGGGGSSAGTGTTSGGSSSPGVAPVALGSSSSGSGGHVPAPVGLEAELGTHAVADRITLLYLAFGLAALAVLLGTRPFFRTRRRTE